jgi:5-methyltetrahydrofolate--homocysteine methyltransferase
MIGERINPTGRKRLGALMAAGDFSLVRQDALNQIAAGASVLDVNAGYPSGDEIEMLVEAVQAVEGVAEVPLSIDSSVPAALAAALSVYHGKALVNSVTAEEERLERILPLVRKYHAAVIGMAHDECGISDDPAKRLAAARKIVERAEDHGIPPGDVVIDPLCMSVATNSQAGPIAFETMRLIRHELGVNMCCGASNVSFGLPERGAISAAFLPIAMSYGLTSAIADVTNPLIRHAVLAGELVLGRDEYASRWIAHCRETQKTARELAPVG